MLKSLELQRIRQDLVTEQQQQSSPSSRESAAKSGDTGWGLTPGSGRSPGVRNGNQLQDSCQEHFMDRGACERLVNCSLWSHKGSNTTDYTHTHTHTHTNTHTLDLNIHRINDSCILKSNFLPAGSFLWELVLLPIDTRNHFPHPNPTLPLNIAVKNVSTVSCHPRDTSWIHLKVATA